MLQLKRICIISSIVDRLIHLMQPVIILAKKGPSCLAQSWLVGGDGRQRCEVRAWMGGGGGGGVGGMGPKIGAVADTRFSRLILSRAGLTAVRDTINL